MATTDPKPPERTVHVRQERIEGGVGVSVGRADKVIFNNDKLWVFGMLSLGLFAVVGLVSFALNIARVQDGLCRAPGLRGACVALDLGHLPSPEEEASWAVVQPGDDCEALREHLSRWPAGVFATEAQARLDGRSVTADTRWAPQEMRLPMTVRGEAFFDDEQAAREDALRRAAALADETCAPLRLSPLHRLVGSTSSVTAWTCAPIGRRWRCGLDGAAVCDLEVGRSLTLERCSSSEEIP